MEKTRTVLQSTMAILCMAGSSLWAQNVDKPQDRLTGEISEQEWVTLPGNVQPAIAHASSEAPVDPSFPMAHMILLLRPDGAHQQALDDLVAQQYDPTSSLYHQFLTTEQFAARFGVSPSDMTKITGWLSQHGFQVEEVTPNNLSIVFSGDAYAVQTTFRTEVKKYSVNGETHYANASDPQIPAALAGVVQGIVKLHDFHSKSSAQSLPPTGEAANPLYTVNSTTHYLAPADWAMIYDVRPLYSGNLNGSGQSIAIVGRSNVNMSDIQTFRAQFGLPANNPTVIVAQGSNPGVATNGDQVEAALDVEWAGAIAPQAQVKFVISSSTAAADGIDLASMYAVNHSVAPVLSVSYGNCEAAMGSASGPNGGTELAFYNALWEQAAAQGISVFVAAGDSGAAGCDSATASQGTVRSVNGMCSSPYATCVGGTQFNEGSNTGLYWLPGNNAILGTAQSYIPEIVWNQSGTNGGSGLAAGGGGVSTQWTKPSWQIGAGVPNEGYRDVPDLSVSASAHDAYIIYLNGSMVEVSGTSAASPSLASLFTIVNQKYNGSQGSANPVLYPLAIKQAQGGGKVFHDVTSGNNTVPGVSGYSAAAGYDLASGLGSIDGLQLVNHFHDVSLNGTFTLTAAQSNLTIQAGQNASVGTTIAISNGFNWPVALTVSGVPSGVTPTFSVPNIPAPGAGSSVLQFASGISAAAGTYTVTITATGGNITKTATVTLTVTAIPERCSLTASPTSVALPLGQATNVRLSCTTPQGGLPTSLALAVSGQPTGVTTSFSPTTLTPGTTTTSLTITAASTATAGAYTLAVTASGGTFSQTINVPLTLAIPPNISVTMASSSISVVQATSATVGVTVANIGSFSAPTTLALNGAPSGMTASLSPTGFAAPGAGSSTLTLSPSSQTPIGRYTINVVTTGGGLSKSIPLTVTVTAAPNFTLLSSQAAATVQAGQTPVTVAYTVENPIGGFNAPVTMSVSGLPTGVTGTFSATTFAAPGTGTSLLTLTAASTMTAGQYRLTVSAVGGTVTQNVSLTLVVTGLPGFNLKTDVSSLALTAGASFSTTVSISAINNFNSVVNLSLGTIPTGITATFSSSTITGANGTSMLTIQTASTLANGTYTISLSGASSVIPTALAGQTTTISITIGSVTTSLASNTVTVARGTSGTVVVSDTAANFAGSISFSASGVPNYVSYSFSSNAVTGSSSTTLTLAVGSSATPGTYSMYVRTTAGGNTTQTPLSVVVQ